nr:toxin-antitoxin system YwqK family antitoxin [uncultured Pedobacter sp.]
MAQQVRLVSNLFLWIAFSFFGCTNVSAPNGKKLSLNADSNNFQNRNGIIFLENTPYSGLVYTLYANSTDTAEIKSYLNGKEDGEWLKYYEDGKLKEKRFFKNGLKEGPYLAWWQNGKKQLQFNFVNDEYEGVCSQWNKDGRLIQQMTYKKGYEEGPQKMFYDNGKVRSNYIIKNGRRFGLLGTKNCINASDSVFKK